MCNAHSDSGVDSPPIKSNFLKVVASKFKTQFLSEVKKDPVQGSVFSQVKGRGVSNFSGDLSPPPLRPQKSPLGNTDLKDPILEGIGEELDGSPALPKTGDPDTTARRRSV